MFVCSWFERSDFHIVDADGVLEIAVTRQPRNGRGCARDICGFDTRRSQRGVLSYDHGTSSVLGRLSVVGDRTNADAMRLRGKTSVNVTKGKQRKNRIPSSCLRLPRALSSCPSIERSCAGTRLRRRGTSR